MHNINEAFEVVLHKVSHHKTPFIVTLHCSLSFDIATEKAHTIINTILKGSDLSLDDVTVYYYIFSSRLDNLCEMSFDVYMDRYIGNRVAIIPFTSVHNSVKIIHTKMIERMGVLN